MNDALRDVLLPPLPLHSLERRDAGALALRPDLLTTTVALGRLLEEAEGGVVTSACRVPPGLGGLLVERPLGIGDRRDVLWGADRALSGLPPGSKVRCPDSRVAALLRAHHPALVPAGPAGATSDPSPGQGPVAIIPEVRPLWPDPAAESEGEVLEPDSWLPAPGQGVAVLVHAVGDTPRFESIEADPGAEVILRAERAVGEAAPFAVPLVRAQLFGAWLSIHAVVLTEAADRMVRGRVRGDRDDPVGVAHRLVELLAERGLDRLRPPEGVEDRPAGVSTP